MDIFEELLCANTAPGKEGAVAKIISEYFKDTASEIKTDALGNLIVKLGNESENHKKVAVFVPMDAPGLVVTYLNDNGTVCVSSVGNCDYRCSCASEVTDGKITGILIPDNEGSDCVEKSHVDFGFKDKQEAEKYISQGDTLFFKSSELRLLNGNFAGVGLGNKASVSAVCRSAKKLTDGRCVYLVFCVQSTLYQRGSYSAAFGIKPDIALCIAPFNGTSFGVKVLDKSVVCDKELTEIAFNAVKKYDEDAKRVVLEKEMSDAGKISSAFAGVHVASILFPAKNLNSTIETVNDAHIETLSDIIAEVLNNI